MAGEVPQAGLATVPSDVMDSKVIVVSGATSGIGQEIATQAVGSGHQVIGLYHSNTDAAADAARRAPGLLSMLQVDLRSKHASTTAIAQVFNSHGRLDALINCAGVNRRAPFLEGDVDDWRDVFETNVLAVMALSQAAAAAMVGQRSGRIVNMSSVAADYALGDRLPYEASKAAVNRITKSLAYELSPHGIQVNAIAPGLVRTPMTEHAGEEDLHRRVAAVPAGRLGGSDEIARLALYVAVEAPPYLTGAVIPIDGGRTT